MAYLLEKRRSARLLLREKGVLPWSSCSFSSVGPCVGRHDIASGEERVCPASPKKEMNMTMVIFFLSPVDRGRDRNACQWLVGSFGYRRGACELDRCLLCCSGLWALLSPGPPPSQWPESIAYLLEKVRSAFQVVRRREE